MQITFDTKNKEEVAEVVLFLTTIGVTLTETIVEETEKKKTTPTIPKEKKAVEPKSEPQKSEIKLADLKESAKNAVTRSSREDVKKTISEFAEKLAEVNETDYGKLYKKLQELGV